MSDTSVLWNHTLSRDGTNRQTTTLGVPTHVVGLVYTMYTVNVTVQDLAADGLEACTKIEAVACNDNQGHMEPQTYCDTGDMADGAATNWYTFSSRVPSINGYMMTQYVTNPSTGETVYSERPVTVSVDGTTTQNAAGVFADSDNPLHIRGRLQSGAVELSTRGYRAAW